METKKKIVTAALCAALGAAAAYGTRLYIRRTRAEMVFNETGSVYEEILNKGLPDGTSTGGIGETLKKLLGFDIKEPESIIESYSSVFGEDEDEFKETAAPKETVQPEPELPPYSEISVSRGIAVNNATGYSVDPDASCAAPLSFGAEENEPLILIMHTHTTECYDGDNMAGETERTTDHEKNVSAVGDKMMEIFEGYGIHCVHDTTIHDFPTYQGAYTRALDTIERELDQYPSVKLVFDIHRDAFVYQDGSKLRVECEIDGKTAAKAMIVCGTDSMGLYHPNWRENFALAAKIQNAAQIMYPGLMRPINLRKERFNMHTTTGSLLFEIGSNGNTLDEALLGGECLAKAISAVLVNLRNR